VFRAVKLVQNEIMFHLLGKTLSLRLKLMRYDINNPDAPNDSGSTTWKRKKNYQSWPMWYHPNTLYRLS